MGAAQIATIASTPIDGTGGGSAPSASMSSSSASSESTAPQTSFSFDTVQPKAAKEQPIKTYVVGNDVTKQQEFDRQKISNGRL